MAKGAWAHDYAKYNFRHSVNYDPNTNTHYVHNGMNLRKSVGVPTSRFERIRTYLKSVGGSATKREILRDVFNVQYDGTGWGSYVFSLGVKYGHFTLVRKNRTVYWTLTDGSLSQADGV